MAARPSFRCRANGVEVTPCVPGCPPPTIRAHTDASISRQDRMTEDTPNLDLPYIMPAQAQKHVTHNEALDLIDTLLQCAVADRDLSEPPEEAQEGERYIVAADASGTWAGREGTIALRREGGWRFLTPRIGWRAWVVDEAVLVFWNGDAWEKVTGSDSALQNLVLLGLGTVADSQNPFA